MTATLPDFVIAAFVTFCRVGGCFMVMPGLSSARVPLQIRLFVAVRDESQPTEYDEPPQGSSWVTAREVDHTSVSTPSTPPNRLVGGCCWLLRSNEVFRTGMNTPRAAATCD